MYPSYMLSLSREKIYKGLRLRPIAYTYWFDKGLRQTVCNEDVCWMLAVQDIIISISVSKMKNLIGMSLLIL